MVIILVIDPVTPDIATLLSYAITGMYFYISYRIKLIQNNDYVLAKSNVVIVSRLLMEYIELDLFMEFQGNEKNHRNVQTSTGDTVASNNDISAKFNFLRGMKVLDQNTMDTAEKTMKIHFKFLYY